MRSAKGSFLSLATKAGMRCGRSSENWRRSLSTGGRPTVRKYGQDGDTADDEDDDGDAAAGPVATEEVR